MTMGLHFFLWLASSAATAVFAELTVEDYALAYMPRPLPSSHVIGSNGKEVFDLMNRHLLSQPINTSPCETWKLGELNELAKLLYSKRDLNLAKIYAQRADNRQFHFDSMDYKQQLWAMEDMRAKLNPAEYGPGTHAHAVVRDGKCAELVMWWVHHLSSVTRDTLTKYGVKIPLLPQGGFRNTGNHEYHSQITCSSCHTTGLGRTPDALLNTSKKDSLPQLSQPEISKKRNSETDPEPGTCPTDPSTGLPIVWYQPMSAVGKRLKRCDGDYDPPCGLCEGIGGWIWGEQQDEITYTSCRPIAVLDDIPEENRTKPVWPMEFEVEEITILINQVPTQFPGADPCATHVFKNDSQTMWYSGFGPNSRRDTREEVIFALENANMFIRVVDNPILRLCICVTPYETGDRETKIGPLFYNFAEDSRLIGRELIGLEGLNREVEADHWVKGPHHFWIEVETNEMVRGWQPWNGLNVYFNWQKKQVPMERFDVGPVCYQGANTINISCTEPYIPTTTTTTTQNGF